jgi:1-acyl-sn-glycerol-3-phosphate acyltransferase
LAAAWNIPPNAVLFDADIAIGRSPRLPLLSQALDIRGDGNRVAVKDNGPERLDLSLLESYWLPRWADSPMARLRNGLCRRFLRRIRFEDPETLQLLRSQPVLMVSNHQVHIESVLFDTLAGPLFGTPPITISRVEHRSGAIGEALALTATFPCTEPYEPILYFDRDNPVDMLRLLADYRSRVLPAGRSLMVHVAGEVGLSCRDPVTGMSSVLLDLATQCGLPVVPMRFVGGLPVAPLAQRRFFPLDYGRQDIVFGTPIMPDQLLGQGLAGRRRRVIDAINALPPSPELEEPLPGDQDFARRVARRQAPGVEEIGAVLQEVMADAARADPGLRPFAEGRLPTDWTGEKAVWGRRFLTWLGYEK